MTTLNEHFTAACGTSNALAEAKGRHARAINTLWQTLAPIVSRHQSEIGTLFEEAGFPNTYENRFGEAGGSGARLTSISTSDRYLELNLVEYFRGEEDRYTFRLPLAYLKGAVEEVFARELAHYRRVFRRIGRAQEEREAVESRAENLKELARLTELFKNDPDAAAALAALSLTQEA